MVICPLSLIAITRKLKVKWNKNYSGLRKLINHVLKASHMPIENVNVSCSFDIAASLFFCFVFCMLVLWLMSACLTARGHDRGHEKGKEHRVKCLLHTSLYDDLKWRWPRFRQVGRLLLSQEQYSCQTNHNLNHYMLKTIGHKKSDVDYFNFRQ